jgi:hypothetical protein
MIINANNILGTDLIWFIELDYLGGNTRFSTLTMTLHDADGYSFPYSGGLEDVDLNSRLQKVGLITAQQDSVSIAITFQNRNVSQDYVNGLNLDGVSASIGYVTMRHGEIEQKYEERLIVFKGQISQPIFGHPDQPAGYVEFSVDNIATISEQPLLKSIIGDNQYVENVAITPDPNANKTPPFPVSDEIVNVAEIHKGKVIPFVFGDLDGVITNTGSISIPMTPAYVIAYDTGGTKPCYYVCAGHITEATSIKCFDNTQGLTDTADVLSFVNIDQHPYSYFTLDQTSSFPQSVAAGNDRQVWVEWTNVTAYPNPFGKGSLSGAGDILLFFLMQITEDLDIDAWNAARPELNEYKFAGYVNDDKITIIEFIQKNILAYLPISIINAGPRGLRPVFSMQADGIEMVARTEITTNPEFFRTSPITTQSAGDDIINHVMVRFGKNGITNTYTSYASVTAHKAPNARILFGMSSISLISKTRYGTKRKVFDLDYCYDAQTAVKIANNIVSENAIPRRTITYSASNRYGYLELGDLIKVTDSDLGFVSHFMQIVSKQFTDNSWLFQLQIYDNPQTVIKTIV